MGPQEGRESDETADMKGESAGEKELTKFYTIPNIIYKNNFYVKKCYGFNVFSICLPTIGSYHNLSILL